MATVMQRIRLLDTIQRIAAGTEGTVVSPRVFPQSLTAVIVSFSASRVRHHLAVALWNTNHGLGTDIVMLEVALTPPTTPPAATGMEVIAARTSAAMATFLNVAQVG